MPVTVIAALVIHVLVSVFWAGTTFTLARLAGLGVEKLVFPQLGGAGLEDLCHQLALRGVPLRNAQTTIEEFDRAAEHNVPGRLRVQRAAGLHTCRKPPFYAVPVRAGVTFTEGGIRVDSEGKALDRDGHPVPGLYVAGVDVGAISNVGYAGALSAALITGLRSGIHAARWAQTAVAS